MSRLLGVLAAGVVATLGVVLAPIGASGRGAPDCPTGLPGPALVRVPAGAETFCIDQREVTQRDYAAFLESTKGHPRAQAATCAWNDTFLAPEYDDHLEIPVGECGAGVLDFVTRGDHAMTCVDWCDANAYCEWAGKRLCDGMGDRKESLATQKDAKSSEWAWACTAGGTAPHAYGRDHSIGKCVESVNPDEEGFPDTRGRAECSGAEAPFDRLRDMIGNVYEWTAACDGQGTNCSIQGGYYGTERASCASAANTYVRNTLPTVGFRCCADLM